MPGRIGRQAEVEREDGRISSHDSEPGGPLHAFTIAERCGFLQQFPAHVVMHLLGRGVVHRDVPCGRIICKQGKEVKFVHIIASGIVTRHKVTTQEEIESGVKPMQATALDPHGPTTHTLNPGGVLGDEMEDSAADPSLPAVMWTHTAVVREMCTYISISKDALAEQISTPLVQIHPIPRAAEDALRKDPRTRRGAEKEAAAGLLGALPFFSNLAHDALKQLSGELRLVALPAKARIYAQGQRAECLYIVLKGSVSLHSRSVLVGPGVGHELDSSGLLDAAGIHKDMYREGENSGLDILSKYGPCNVVLREGDVFGEGALLDAPEEGVGEAFHAKCDYSAFCRTAAELLCISRQHYAALSEQGGKPLASWIQASKGERTRRLRRTLQKPPEARTEEDLDELMDLARHVPFLFKIRWHVRKQLCRYLAYRRLDRGEVLVQQGEQGGAMYVFLGGSATKRRQVDTEMLAAARSHDGGDDDFEFAGTSSAMLSLEQQLQLAHGEGAVGGSDHLEGHARQRRKSIESGGMLGASSRELLGGMAALRHHIYGPCGDIIMVGDSYGEHSVQPNSEDESSTVVIQKESEVIVLTKGMYGVVLQNAEASEREVKMMLFRMPQILREIPKRILEAMSEHMQPLWAGTDELLAATGEFADRVIIVAEGSARKLSVEEEEEIIARRERGTGSRLVRWQEDGTVHDSGGGGGGGAAAASPAPQKAPPMRSLSRKQSRKARTPSKDGEAATPRGGGREMLVIGGLIGAKEALEETPFREGYAADDGGMEGYYIDAEVWQEFLAPLLLRGAAAGPAAARKKKREADAAEEEEARKGLLQPVRQSRDSEMSAGHGTRSARVTDITVSSQKSVSRPVSAAISVAANSSAAAPSEVPSPSR